MNVGILDRQDDGRIVFPFEALEIGDLDED
jgi:hypothetical protein